MTPWLLLASLLHGSSALGQTETSQTFGDYTVHYIAVNTTFLDPAIASQYNITRGQRRGFLNISVLKNNPDAGTTAVTASIEGSRNNMLQQSEPIEFTEVREGDAIYYLGEFEFSNAEPVRFELMIQPEKQGPFYPLQWSTRLYIN
ncbi:MAG: DUF4426 domain-containing protein [Pseudohongiellaceae bacterium]